MLKQKMAIPYKCLCCYGNKAIFVQQAVTAQQFSNNYLGKSLHEDINVDALTATALW